MSDIMPAGRSRSILSTVVALGLCFWSAAALTQTTQRPISDFLETQGTFCVDDGAGGCVIFVPPVANFVGFTDTLNFRGASVDYAGLSQVPLGGTLGTTFAAGISERTLPD